jgi:general secretion pathway protein H
VVLALIGLMMAALPAVLSAGLPGLRLKSEARHMVEALRDARALALKSRKEVTLTFDAEGSRYGIAPRTQSSTLSTGITLGFHDIPYAEAKGETARIRFFPDGSSTGGSVALMQKGQRYWIEVDWLTGRVSRRD